MSSLTRRIQRTVKRDKEGAIKDARHHHGGRGSKLGVVNMKDPCRTGRRKAKKVRRADGPARPPFVMSKAVPLPTRAQGVAKHRSKMEWKRQQRAKVWLSSPKPTANVSRRHPDADLTPGQHARRKAERML